MLRSSCPCTRNYSLMSHSMIFYCRKNIDIDASESRSLRDRALAAAFKVIEPKKENNDLLSACYDNPYYTNSSFSKTTLKYLYSIRHREVTSEDEPNVLKYIRLGDLTSVLGSDNASNYYYKCALDIAIKKQALEASKKKDVSRRKVKVEQEKKSQELATAKEVVALPKKGSLRAETGKKRRKA